MPYMYVLNIVMNVVTKSGLSILVHCVISYTDTKSYDMVFYFYNSNRIVLSSFSFYKPNRVVLSSFSFYKQKVL